MILDKVMGTDDIHKRRKAKKKKDLQRKQGRRKPYDKILIVCEGSETECIYFNLFRDHLKLATANVVIDPNSDSSPTSVVRYALKLAENSTSDPYDKVFCVIDRDTHKDFYDAINLIMGNNEKKGMRTKLYGIVSDPCFEYWLLLHFVFTTRQFGQGKLSPCEELIKDELEKYIQNYSKSDKKVLQNLIADGYYKQAIKFAQKVFENSIQSSSKSPQTNVFVLIECLENLKEYNCDINEAIPLYNLL